MKLKKKKKKKKNDTRARFVREHRRGECGCIGAKRTSKKEKECGGGLGDNPPLLKTKISS